MKRILPVIAAVVIGSSLGARTLRAASPPTYDHVVILMEENRDYSQIIGSSAAPYINSLASQGANFTKSYGEEHHSEGNYFWLFSGSRQTVPDFNDGLPAAGSINAANLSSSLAAKGYTFTGYSEDLPSVGWTGDTINHYARKHNPWVNFSNVPTVSNKPYTGYFPADYSTLPTVSWVVPNLIDDMHDGPDPAAITAGDTWAKNNLDGYYQWAKTHNSLLIVTFDENNGGTAGMTDPLSSNNKNLIPTIFVGASIIPGNYAEGNGITHVNVLRTLEAMYGLPTEGAQAPLATAAGINANAITDVFTVPEPTAIALLTLGLSAVLLRRNRKVAGNKTRLL